MINTWPGWAEGVGVVGLWPWPQGPPALIPALLSQAALGLVYSPLLAAGGHGVVAAPYVALSSLCSSPGQQGVRLQPGRWISRGDGCSAAFPPLGPPPSNLPWGAGGYRARPANVERAISLLWLLVYIYMLIICITLFLFADQFRWSISIYRAHYPYMNYYYFSALLLLSLQQKKIKIKIKKTFAGQFWRRAYPYIHQESWEW